MRVRLVRSHDCLCGFWNEFDVATVNAGDARPPIDMAQTERCPQCKRDVAVGRVLELPIRGERLTV